MAPGGCRIDADVALQQEQSERLQADHRTDLVSLDVDIAGPDAFCDLPNP